jgi:hypothetical protein
MPKPENLIPYRMKKGTTLNPNGRPKGSRNRSTIARQWLGAVEKIKNPLTQEIDSLTQEDIMTLALINKARKGDVNAYKALMDSGYGAPKQEIENTVVTQKPILSINPILLNKSEEEKQDLK